MTTNIERALRLAGALGLLAAWAVPVRAQMLAGSARAAGMADAYGAVARGAAAGLYNPANLGLPGNPRFSLTLPGASADYGSTPITMGELDEYGGTVVPADVKRRWLDAIPADGSLRMRGGADVSALGASFGSLAFNAGGVAHATADMPRDAVELFLFGNAGADGEPRDMIISDAAAEGFAASFLSASYGMPVLRRGAAGEAVLSVGLTAKYVMGNGYFAMRDAGGTLSADPIVADLTFPAVTVWNDDGWRNASGVGFDLGVAYHTPRLAAGLTVHDAINTFEWNLRDAMVRDGRAFVSEDSSAGGFDERPLDDPELDPAIEAEARDLVADAVFRPVLRASVAYQTTGQLLLSADLVRRTGKGSLQGGPETVASVGAEFRPLGPTLPLRAGGALMTGGSAWSLGAGVAVGGVTLDAAYSRRYGDGAAGERVSLGLTLGG